MIRLVELQDAGVFVEVWGLSSLNDYTLALSLVMNIIEVLAGC
jgi:hypothetical protein